MMMMSGSHGRESKYPFTASQWQELEHQALIFKYMAAGHPIPSDLILPIRRSMFLESAAAAATSPASLFPQHPNSLGWGYFQMGFGRKTEDPEPGRCRRTDGKKWRCSKEAHPDSKYCERHMHRGKNRSRKPVEMSLTSAAANPVAPTSAALAPAATSSSSCSSSTITVASNNISALYHPLTSPNSYEGHQMYAAAAGYASSYRPPPTAPACGIGLATHAAAIHHPASSSATQFHTESLGGASFADRDYNRYFNPGLTKDEVPDQYSGGFSTANADGSWRFTQLGLGGADTAKQQQQRDHHYASSLLHHNAFCGGGAASAAYSHHVPATDSPKDDKLQQQHCFVLGADIRQMDKGTADREGCGGRDHGDDDRKQHKPLRHFFDEWPLKNDGGGAAGKDSWIGSLDDDDTTRSGGGGAPAASHNWSSSTSSFSNTQLSISTPMASHDLSLQW